MRGTWTAAIVFLFTFGQAGAAPPPRVEAFGRIPSVESVVVSPGGTLLAWADSSTGKQQVVMFDVDRGAEKRRLTMPADSKLRDLDWHDDETLLVSLSFTHSVGSRALDKYEWRRTLAVDTGGGDMRMLLMDGTRSLTTGSRLLALRTSKPKTVMMATWDFAATKYTEEIGSRLRGGRKDDGWVLSLFEVSTITGKGTRVEMGGPYTADWVLDLNGQAIGRTEWEPERSLFRVLHKRGDTWNEIHKLEDGTTLGIAGLSRDGKSLVAVGPNGLSRSALWEIALDGSGAKLLLEDPVNDIEHIVLDGYNWQPVAASVGGADPVRRWLDSDAEARHKALSKTFGGLSVSIQTRDSTNTRVIARVGSPSTPTTYYLVDFAKGKADIVGEDYPELAGVTLGQVQVLSYKSRDGVDIPAYLTVPAGLEQNKLPLVVLPHGGPQARDELAFDWMAQFIASRGYAVLQPQFRGSTGFGESFRLAGYRQWGGVMQNDVTDGVKAMIDQGIVDPRRVCIVGASYGGYAALAGAAFTPELYACAVSINGVTDLPGMLGHALKRSGEESNTVAYWTSHIGSAQDPLVIGRSPARSAQTIQAPVLLIHGTDDTIVPIMQSQLMASALKGAGKSYAFAKLDGEDHALSRSETRMRVLQELEGFLGKFLSPSN
ncbi:dienelactone hydrolase [Povalibacter uvarum]|uniref:Dienelactone hydrolase n=1 Tax=Povalibacter uvarum TaxID=732238 RepID=A0A841HFB0_9GAMM|nr:prolyl oligopeptidase family serine peptidase [Povalibacter uvarum]MBB6091373.1 dienelactone hydrolase [Povalibacter uvarum]